MKTKQKEKSFLDSKVSRDINVDSAHEYSAGNWMCRGIAVEKEKQNKRGSEMTNVTAINQGRFSCFRFSKWPSKEQQSSKRG